MLNYGVTPDIASDLAFITKQCKGIDTFTCIHCKNDVMNRLKTTTSYTLVECLKCGNRYKVKTREILFTHQAKYKEA